MQAKVSELLLHPIRLRIVLALGSQALTTAEIAKRLPHVPQATLYRQIGTLAEAGMLEVVAERRARGSVERSYAVVASAVQVEPDDIAAMTPVEHLRGFITFVGSLIGSMSRYLDEPGARPASDGLAYRQAALWLSDAERERLGEQLGAVLAPYLHHEPTSERSRVLLNTILIPDPDRPPAA